MKEVRRIPILREPHHLALSPDGSSLLVGDTSGNQMLFLDPNTGEVQKRIPMVDPYQLGFSPDGKFLTVNGLARNQVDIYDAATMKLVKRFPVVATPSHLAYSPDSSTVFVSLQDSDKLAAFDLRTMTEKWTVPVGKTPAGVMWLNGKVLVADMGTDYLAAVDPANGKVVAHIVTGKGAHQLFLSPDGKILVGQQPRRRHHRVAGQHDAEADPQLTISPAVPTIWPSRRMERSGSHGDGRRRWRCSTQPPAAMTTIDVGRSPHGLFLNPNAPSPTVVSSR